MDQTGDEKSKEKVVIQKVSDESLSSVDIQNTFSMYLEKDSLQEI